MSAVRTSDGVRGLIAIHVFDGTDLLSVVRARVRTAANQLKSFLSAMSAVASPATVGGFKNSATAIVVTSGQTTAEAVGGVPPFTYAWARTDGGGHSWTITAAAAASTRFQSEVDPANTEEATFVCTVTDSTGAEAVTNEVSARITNLGGGLL